MNGASHSVRIVPATVHGRYLVRAPGRNPPRGWLVGFHGYGQSAEEFLAALERIPAASDWLIASVQALHPFYTRSQQVVANWMTRLDREHAIADNIAYVDTVVADLERGFGPPGTLVFAGFSQGVAMAYRAAVLGRHPCAAVIAAGGDVPPELVSAAEHRWPRVLVCTGSRDEFYTPRHVEKEMEFFRARGIDAQSLVFHGGHTWSNEIVAAADGVLNAVAGLA